MHSDPVHSQREEITMHVERRIYIQMLCAALPVMVLNLMAYSLFGFETIPANDTEGYNIALTMMGVSFVVLGAAIASFRASITRLKRSLDPSDFSFVLSNKICRAIFFSFGFILAIMLIGGGSGETNPFKMGEIELMRQASTVTMVIFLGVISMIAIKFQMEMDAR
jgi:hypothetical protein